jgi:SAM-dependent methyltransferase
VSDGKNTKANVAAFSRDVTEDGSYAYTKNHLSALLANKRISEAFAALYPAVGKRLLDLGCGDGTYSLELARAGAEYVLGVDPSEAAVATASAKAAAGGLAAKVGFCLGNIYDLAITEHFDCLVLRGVLHHLPNPGKALRAAAPLADNILIMEPNGLNPVVKIIEKTSRYHREHEEQSFSLSCIRAWLEAAGFRQCVCRHVNLVPMFCPDWLARVCKTLEPIVETLPIIRNITCGQYIILGLK